MAPPVSRSSSRSRARRPKRRALLEKARTWADSALSGAREGSGCPRPDRLGSLRARPHRRGGGPRRGRAPSSRSGARVRGQAARGARGEDDRALRIFNAERFHVFEDFALFLARASASRPADLPRALAISDQGRVGALEELLKLRGIEAPSWTSAKLDVEALKRSARAAHAVVRRVPARIAAERERNRRHRGPGCDSPLSGPSTASTRPAVPSPRPC